MASVAYVIGEKVFSFVMASERNPEFSAELPAFIAEIRWLFTAEEIHSYLDLLRRIKFLTPGEPDGELDDPDDETEEDPPPDNSEPGAQELFRFSRVRQLLQESTEPPSLKQ